MNIAIKQPYAGQFFVLNEDNEFECEHELYIEHDSFSHDWNGGGVQEVTLVECEYGCDVPDHVAQNFIDGYYADMEV